MRSPFHILYLVIFFWPAVCLQAQDSTAFAFESLTTFNELSSNTIQDVTQDDDGFLWIATADGLNRFDGTEVVQFLHDNTPNSIPSNHVSRVLRLPGNKLAIGTTAGLCLYDLHKKIVQNFHYKDSSGLEQYDNFIYRLTTDRDGNIWIGTPSCIIQLSPQLVFKKIFRSSYTRNDIGKVRMNYVQKIVRLSQGRLLFYLISGIKVYEPALDSLVDINDKRNNPLSFLRNTFHWQVFEAGNNQLFILKTGIDSIYLFNEDQNTLRSTGYPHNRYPFVAWELQISKINETRFVISHHEYGFSNLSIVNGTPVLSPVIYSRDIQFGKVFADRQSNWWFINRYGGLLKKIGEQSRFTYFPLYDKRTNQSITLAVNTIKKIDGLFWLSTYGRGIFIYNPVTGQKTQLYLRGLGDEINSNFIWQFYEYSADTLWVGTQKGLLWMHKKKFTYGPLRNYAGKPRELDSFAITTQFEDSHGQLWIGLGAGHGVCVFDKNTQSFRYYKGKDINGYPFRYPLYIAEDSKKRRWFVSDQNSRLLYYDSARDRMIPVDVLTKNINSPIAFTCLSIDKRDVFWIGSNAGLIRFDPATHQSKFYGRHDGLCNSFVEHIYIDETGKLWIGTDGGLSCFDPVKETFSNFYKKYGLPIDIVTGDFYKDTATGLVYTGGTGGFISFNPGGVLKTSPELVKLLITGIQVNSKAYDADPLKLISLSNKEKNLSVSFSAVDLVNGPLSKYSYQLKGSTDTSWINLGRQRQINFSNLAAGAYALSIRSIDEAGNPNSQPVLLHFRIIPPFTQTAWFYLLILLLTAGIFYLLYRYRVKQLMAMEKVRGTISRDLHDEIGANLTNISLLSLLGQKNVADPKQVSGLLTRIYDDSRTVSESMREIVWSINPQNDSLEKTLPNMLRYASEMLEAKGIQLQANLPENIDKIRLDMEQRRDLYLIFKEVINNLAKHSAAGKAFITFRFANGFLYMSAEDDGRGFDTTLPFSSNGIRNMKERAAKQKWKIAINSAPLKGTKIELEAQMA